MRKNLFVKSILFLSLGLIFVSSAFAQRSGYTKDEFVRRRAALADKAKEGMIVLFGEALPQAGAHFRQDNDFFYFTGVDDLGAVLILNAKTKDAHLFLPRQTPREAMVSGPNLLADEKAKDKLGLANLFEITYLDEFIARNARAFAPAWLRLQPGDTVDNDRDEAALFAGRKNRTHYNDQISLDGHRIQKLKERYPSFEFKDVTPFIDSLRYLKTPEEIAILKRNGRLSAEAVKQAMFAGRPGVFEYEIEAAAMNTILKGGARGAAYPPIVGSGPNTCVWHYEKNGRKTESGDLVLMDFGADLDQLCMDITRTWPVNGKFTKEQREVYQVVLEVEKACLEAYKPGVTGADVAKYVDEYMKKKGLDSRGLRGGLGHFVGLCVHDVGPRGLPLQEGMVFAIEPALYYPEKNIGIRVEDTVLITKDGCEVLTKGVPKEIDEIENFLSAVQPRKSPGEPDWVAVQHILIAFKGSIPEPKVTRTSEEALALAMEIFERAKKGEDFDALVKKYTDDEYPGIYRMTNFGVTPNKEKKEYPRAGMVRSFGDVGFTLAVGGVGMAVYDPVRSKYGWHIIKRLE
ncbi:MAG: aminopeptidase P N-terminal domain-containing protein [Candidatus Aminicenantes bacterium]|nr:aminopeptidase P N-terminal domain-containing protein [Candidatus Aminicenantes bacterium]